MEVPLKKKKKLTLDPIIYFIKRHVASLIIVTKASVVLVSHNQGKSEDFR